MEQRSEISHGQDARRHPQHHHVPSEVQVRRGRRRRTVWRTQEEEEEEAVLPTTLDHLHRLDTLVLRLSIYNDAGVHFWQKVHTSVRVFIQATEYISV